MHHGNLSHPWRTGLQWGMWDGAKSVISASKKPGNVVNAAVSLLHETVNLRSSRIACWGEHKLSLGRGMG